MARQLQLRCNEAGRRSPSIHWDWLQPVFWRDPPGKRDFVRLPTILKFVEEELRFQKCKMVASDTCSCDNNPHEVVSPGSESTNPHHWHRHHWWFRL
ncbi:hypothetical protein ABMA28_009635 [Loxostege sticticalis]|uniref:Uncharacterized protein n=1 Tax=Loxostege sticticalis TaxID=481309 RepID=A0ABD0SAX0_LOXSC